MFKHILGPIRRILACIFFLPFLLVAGVCGWVTMIIVPCYLAFICFITYIIFGKANTWAFGLLDKDWRDRPIHILMFNKVSMAIMRPIEWLSEGTFKVPDSEVNANI